jgi:hypothetical protein
MDNTDCPLLLTPLTEDWAGSVELSVVACEPVRRLQIEPGVVRRIKIGANANAVSQLERPVPDGPPALIAGAVQSLRRPALCRRLPDRRELQVGGVHFITTFCGWRCVRSCSYGVMPCGK